MPRPGTGTRFAAGAAQALAGLRLPGRMQAIELEREWLFDVAHNPAAAEALAASLQQCEPRETVAIVGVLDDKDVEGIVGPLAARVGSWIAVTADSPRAIAAPVGPDELRDPGPA